MKRAWTRGERRLWAAPLLIAVAAAGVTLAPRAARRALGWPEKLTTRPGFVIRSIAMSSNGALVAAGGARFEAKGPQRQDATVFIWKANTSVPTLVATIDTFSYRKAKEGYDIYALALSPNAKQVGFSRVYGRWTLYDVATRKEVWSFPPSMKEAEFSPDGRSIALANLETISIVDTRDGKVRTSWKRRDQSNAEQIAWSPDGALLAIIGPRPETGLQPPFSPNSLGCCLELYDARSGRLVRRIERKEANRFESVLSLAFSPDGKKILISATTPASGYSKSDDPGGYAPLRCYATASGKLLWEVLNSTLDGPAGERHSIPDATFMQDGRAIAAYQQDARKILLLDSETGSITKTLPFGLTAHSQFTVPACLEASPDGKRLFARVDNSVLYWDLD